ncbi:hypothetical protein ACEWY4_014242 [Coilia grayii]|uniref:Uncharacterized protein n=1 Tax=Coilia grayii TaxID=363190 RepID=A0ABD1JRS4_9TELE
MTKVVLASIMEERESLKRQIELLQNLIKNHSGSQSSVQQNVSPGSQGDGHNRGPGSGNNIGPSSGHMTGHFSHVTARSQPYTTRPAGSWRKTYSLNNRGSADVTKGPPVQSQTQTQTHTATHSLPASKAVTAPQTSTNFQTHTSPHKGETALTMTKASGPTARNHPPASAAINSAAHPQIGPQLHHSAKPHAVSDGQARPSSSSKSNLNAGLAPSFQHKTASLSQLKDDPAKSQRAKAPLKKSQYRWVKNQEAGMKASESYLQAASSTTSLCPQTSSKTSPGVSPKTVTAISSSRTSLVPQQSSSKKAASPTTPVSHRSVISSGRPRTSKYTWVSHATHATSVTKLTRKPLSPRTLQAPQCPPTSEGIRARKPRTKGGASAAAASQTRLSRYSWRAEATASPAGKGSVYRWTPQKDRGLKAGAFALTTASSPGAFKLRSRMKIIRKTPSRQTQAPVRTPLVRNLPYSRRGNRALVSFGRHKLRLVSPGPGRSTSGFYYSDEQQKAAEPRAQQHHPTCA